MGRHSGGNPEATRYLDWARVFLVISNLKILQESLLSFPTSRKILGCVSIASELPRKTFWIEPTDEKYDAENGESKRFRESKNPNPENDLWLNQFPHSRLRQKKLVSLWK